MHASILLIAAAATSVFAQTPSACLTKCNAEYDACRVVPAGQPSANQATCAAQYASCLGFNPFGTGPNGTFATPTACSAGATGSATATAVPTSACLTKCNAEYDACRVVPAGQPSANQATCAAQYASCLGFNPFGTGPNGTFATPTACSAGATGSATVVPTATAAPSDCLAKCNAEYDACRVVPAGQPSANQATCGAQYASCLGFNPFGTGPNGGFATPTACSAGATGSATVMPTATAVPSDCLAKCNAAYDACRAPPAGQPSANQATCGAQYASCIGFNPFGTGPNGAYVTPTACSAGATGGATVTGKATGTATAQPAPTYVQANGASGLQGGVAGVAGLIAAALMI